MTQRLQRRCLITSAVVHGVLLLLLVLTPGFREARRDLLDAGPPLELLPGALIDQALADRPASALPPEPAPPQDTPQPQVREPEPEPEPPPPRPRPRETPRPEVQRPPPVEVEPEPGRVAPKIDWNKAKPLSPTRSPRTPRPSPAERPSSPNREFNRSLARATAALERSANSDTVNLRIGGGQGSGSANLLYVRNAYNLAWVSPQDVSDDRATVEVEVVIKRDGTVVRSRVVRKSGIAALDRSVESALNKVDRIIPFEPYSDPDIRQVTFTIGFNLQSKRSL